MRAAACALLVALAACGEPMVPGRTSLGSIPIDHPALGREPSRLPRRLSYLQLRRSVTTLLGTSWVEDGVDVLALLAPTLGDPDYQEITTENLETSPLFVKFMEDLANNVCAIAPLATLAPAGNPEADVRALKLALHGEHLPPGDPSLEPLLRLHASDGIRAVCVALLGAPEFYLY